MPSGQLTGRDWSEPCWTETWDFRGPSAQLARQLNLAVFGRVSDGHTPRRRMGTRGKERNTATILLVEGEPNQCRLYQMELEEEGYHVMSASDGKEALQAVEGERPDLVVLDLHIPGMDGVEALGRLLSADSSLPVIIHSAYEGFKDNFTAWSADAYLVKSSNLDGLKQEIQRVLAERARVAGGSAPA